MRQLRGRVAVVTGAASGIGRALSARFAAEGMRVVLADVAQDDLEAVADELRRAGAEALAVPTDVARSADVDALRDRAVERFGAVHVVCNNAGVSLGGPIWEHPLDDWEWVLGVNLWGVIHGVRSFVPLLLAQGDEGHVVNTASMAGLTATTQGGVYSVSKHGVVALSECLHHDLEHLGTPVGVSVLCPSFVATRILDSQRNRPGARVTPPSPASAAAGSQVTSGLAPESVADDVVHAIRERRFWILTHPEAKRRVRARAEDILGGRNPTRSS